MLLGHADRSRMIPAGFPWQAMLAPGRFVNNLLVDGILRATWWVERDAVEAEALRALELLELTQAQGATVDRRRAAALAVEFHFVDDRSPRDLVLRAERPPAGAFARARAARWWLARLDRQARDSSRLRQTFADFR